jgi:hypothetical protein
MNLLRFSEGGRPVSLDDLETLQNLALDGGLLRGLGPCIVFGMTPTAGSDGLFDVSPGLYWDGAQLYDFPGASGAVLPAHVVPDPDLVTDERVYQDGITRACIVSRRVRILSPDASRPQPFVLEVDGGITVWHRFQERLNELGDVKWGRLDTAAYEPSGKGKGRLRGWAIADGRNGTDNLSGRFVVARDPSRADYDTVGKTGGLDEVPLELRHIPDHFHNLNTVRYGQSNNGQNTNTVRTDGRNDGALTGRTASAGGGQAHENRPPFYVLAARQWIGQLLRTSQ